MQTEIGSFSKPAHVRTVERIQQQAADVLDAEPNQAQLDDLGDADE